MPLSPRHHIEGDCCNRKLPTSADATVDQYFDSAVQSRTSALVENDEPENSREAFSTTILSSLSLSRCGQEEFSAMNSAGVPATPSTAH